MTVPTVKGRASPSWPWVLPDPPELPPEGGRELTPAERAAWPRLRSRDAKKNVAE